MSVSGWPDPLHDNAPGFRTRGGRGLSSLHDHARTHGDTVTHMTAPDDDWTYTHDALAETGHEDDPKAWAAIERVRAELAEYGRQLGVRKRDR